ncbi:Glycogen phosphorylase [Caenispirillum salinarum AK4]|uniref:Alpha-1,4 glucan phosphorylase n=1 Tax=Caenispirillum salinarum AK4 TaxID=1238182 RepID=K9GRX7_9PROT|nr:glycogen/starch/alpha-glucan phosphorylase [Caenispirillum salinarum]EKV28715.1 Glycogen phosphorylase [Caenispirillum salinarum AK4]
MDQTANQAAAATAPAIDLSSVEAIKDQLRSFMVHSVGVDPDFASQRDWLYALAQLVRGRLSEEYLATARAQYDADARRVYYLSMEYLTGRSLLKHLYDLGVHDRVAEALKDMGQSLEAIQEFEYDAALGNGGLGRLAACYLDSMATHGYPGFGYGIRYEFGMFTQRVEGGQQVEHPETWLRYGNPWEFERPNVIYPVRFRGRLTHFKNETGETVTQWVDTTDVIAMAYDVPVPGYGSGKVVKLRLWSARATRDFDLRYFNEGNYIDAVKDKTISENLSKVLYPMDTTLMGQELRLMQEYFFVSASLQDIIARHHRKHASLDTLPEKVTIQLNDTHPSLAVPELMRLLIDHYDYDFQKAWDLTREVFNYTNHTLLPEALETWPIAMLEAVLPRHLDLIYKINFDFLQQVKYAFPGQPDVLSRMSLIDDAGRRVRMAHLCVVGSRRVNGVAALHTDLMRAHVFADFNRMEPDKFVNVTNGVTQRRWLLQANRPLADLITEAIGEGWKTDLSRLKDLEPLADDSAFRERFAAIKRANKQRFAGMVRDRTGFEIAPDMMFDTQIKRMHEYKRQLLNVLHVITLYNDLRNGRGGDRIPRAVTFGGKAAPGYFMAKLIIRLINDVAMVINHDRSIRDRLKVAFVPNYNVSAAEIIIPGTDLSEQISTAGTEASGTGNMKFALNGALTIGTLDGANIEIKNAVGDDNIFIFGKTADEVGDMRAGGYHPREYYDTNEALRNAVDMIAGGFFNADDPDRYLPIRDTLLSGGDHFFLMADYQSYIETQAQVEAVYADQDAWMRKAIVNVANMGGFSSDRSIHSYAKDIWRVQPVA